MSDGGPLARVLARLDGVEDRGDHYEALCPGHDDHDPSLRLEEAGENGSRRVLVHCHVCKDQEKVLRALEERGLLRSDLFEDGSGSNRNGGEKARTRMCLTGVYNYKTPDGRFVKHNTLKFEPPPEGKAHHHGCQGDHCHSSRKDKDFRQARPDGNGGIVYSLDGTRTVLYNLADVMRAALAGETIVWVEGEKDADNGRERLGLTTTTCPMGAKHWKPHYAGFLTGAHVVVVPDNDRPGREHAEMVARELLPFAASVKIVALPGVPEGGDLSDWIDLGGTKGDFDTLVEEVPGFHSGHIGGGFGRNELLPVRFLREVVVEAEKTPEFIVKDVLKKGELTDLSGLAKYSGKTTLTMHMLKAVRAGDPFLGVPTKEARVLYLTEQGNNFKEAIEGADLDLDDDGFVVLQQRDVRDEDWPNLVEKAVRVCERDGLEVLVVDTFAAFTKLIGSEENESGKIRERMEPLKKAAQSHNLAVLVVRHAGKDGKGRGSSQFEAEVDIVVTLKRPEGNHPETVRQLETIGRYGATKSNIELTERGYVDRGSDGQVEFGKAIEVIKRNIPRARESAVSQDQLHEEVEGEGVSKKTMQRALKWLVDNETIREEGKGVKGNPYRYWMPPGGGSPLPPPPDDEIHSGQTPSPNGRNGITDDGGRGAAPSKERTEPPHTKEEPESNSDAGGGFVTDSEHVLAHVVPALKHCTEVSLDIETTDLSPFEGEVRVLSLHADGETHLIDCRTADPAPALEAIQDKLLYVHHAEFDLPFLHHAYGFAPTQTPVDTLHLSQVVRAGEWEWDAEEDGKWRRIQHSLEDALERELGVELGDKKKYQKGAAWEGNLTEGHTQYAANDVLHLKPLAQKLFALLEERNLEEVWKLEQRAKPLFLEMCYRGIPFDKDRWDGLVDDLEGKVLELKERADASAPPHPEEKTWNWFSPKQALEAFKLAGLNVPDLKRETLCRYEDPFVEAVSAFRDAKNELSRVRTWYGGRYKDGRIHPQWNPCGTVTGRASCTSPNVQSLTKEGAFRSCIRPRKAASS